VDSYLSNAAPIIISLYLGPKSDQGRKLLMYVPFTGHLLAGLVPIAFLYFPTWPPQVLWLMNIYTLCGGFAVLQIAMNGYLADVTNQKNRTTMMALLAGLAILVFPMAEAVGGQIFNYLGYYAVYIASLMFSVMGLIYICFIPESVPEASRIAAQQNEDSSLWNRLLSTFVQGNRNVVSSAQCIIKRRQGKKQSVVITLLVVTIISTMEWSGLSTVGLMYAEKKFHWGVVQYTNYNAFAFTVFGLRTFVTTPILCYYLGIHDCMLAITGGMASICGSVTAGLATEGWMMYYASGLTIIGGIESTPLKSLLSKCVSSHEFGKIFTLSSIASSLASLIGAVIVPKLYQATLDSLPGAIYFFFASVQVVVVLVITALFVVIIGHEKEFGPLGKDQDDLKNCQNEVGGCQTPPSLETQEC